MTPPRPIYIYGEKVRHIARPDHPRGTAVTDIAFCGAYGDLPPAVTFPVCKRCAAGWFAWLDRLASEEDGDGTEEAS